MGGPMRGDHLKRVLVSSLGHAFTSGNTVEPLENGVEIFPAMLEAMAEARERISLLSFIFWGGAVAEEFAGVLMDRSRDGVRVRVLLDAFGSAKMPRHLRKALGEADVDLRFLRPLRWGHFWQVNNRSHRKVLVCDGSVGFTGGVGIAQEWAGDARSPEQWRETHFRMRGPCVVGLEAAFLENWLETGSVEGAFFQEAHPEGALAGDCDVQVVRSSGGGGWSDVLTATHTLVQQARESIRIATGYFVPDAGLRDALLGALDRGVDVQVMLPGKHTDERLCNLAGAREMSALAEAGAQVWIYEKTMLHHKLLVVDGCCTMLGSPNFNHRSFEQDDEVAAVVLSETLADRLLRDFDRDRQDSVAFRTSRWKQRSAWTRCKVWAARRIRGSL